MRTGLYKRLSNEELVELYKAGESDAFEALLKNTEGLRATLAQRYLNIPGSEFEDLMSEGAIEMLSAIQNFDSKTTAPLLVRFCTQLSPVIITICLQRQFVKKEIRAVLYRVMNRLILTQNMRRMGIA